jgi:hypothetical protein
MTAQAHKAHTWVTSSCLLIYLSDYLTGLVGSLNLQNKHLLSPPVHPSSQTGTNISLPMLREGTERCQRTLLLQRQ